MPPAGAPSVPRRRHRRGARGGLSGCAEAHDAQPRRQRIVARVTGGRRAVQGSGARVLWWSYLGLRAAGFFSANTTIVLSSWRFRSIVIAAIMGLPHDSDPRSPLVAPARSG